MARNHITIDDLKIEECINEIEISLLGGGKWHKNTHRHMILWYHVTPFRIVYLIFYYAILNGISAHTGEYADIMHIINILIGCDKMTQYIITGIIQRRGYRCTISKPFSFLRAYKMFKNITEDMQTAIPKYKWVKDLRIELY